MRYDVEPQPWAGDEDATATINYTSGTTARPKGVQLTHRNLWLNATTFGWHVGVSDRDVYLHTLPQFHCNGWGMLYAVTGMGGRHVIIRKIDGAEILRRVDEHGVTLMCGAPAVVNMVLDAAADLARARSPAATACASSSPAPRRRRARSSGSRPSWAGSSSRSTASPRRRRCSRSTGPAPSSTTSRPAERAVKLNRAGAPAIGCAMDVDAEGEVLARSNVVMAGYWEQPEATAEAIVDGWFHTGDGGSIDELGYVTISDRKKDVIISGGENVSSIEVEDAIFQHPDVTEVAVIGIPDEKWGELVTALVVTTPGERADPRGRHRLHPPEAGWLQVPEAGRVPRRAGPHGHRQAAEVQAARPVLGRPDAPGELSTPTVRSAAPQHRVPPRRRSGAGSPSCRGTRR